MIISNDTTQNTYIDNYKNGLSSEEVKERISKGLVNYDVSPKTKTIKEIILNNLFTYFNILNFIIASIIIITGILNNNLISSLKNCLFLGVVICNTVISITEEIISKRIIDKLSFITSSKSKVIRNKEEVEVQNNEIVLDDIICYQEGNQVPADSIIISGMVEANEAFITGEAEPVIKNEGDTLLSGSFIISGKTYAKVKNVGKDNYINAISYEAKHDKKVNSIILTSFEKILKILSIIIVPIGILFFINQYKVTSNVYESIFAVAAGIIGMIPGGLILLTSSVMATSVIKLSKYNVLVQKLYCIETLSRVDTICLDKTGTLTEGKMKVTDIIVKDGHSKEEIESIIKDINYNSTDNNSTSEALNNYFGKESTRKVIKKIPFSSNRKYGVITFDDGTYYLGAKELIFKNKEIKEDIDLSNVDESGRIITLASSKVNDDNINILAYIILKDEIRPSSKKVLKYFEKENIDVKIISGDNDKTVASIAKASGLKNIKSRDASTLEDKDIYKAVTTYNVFGRVTPHQKKKIVNALKKHGRTVAMTGDGVNDVLALKEADCSIALSCGSDASRNVSELVLLDSNFNSIPHIINEGRRIINNIERSASLLLTKTIFTIFLILICIVTGTKYFFIPIQLTLITMFTIGIPSFMLALEGNNSIVSGNFIIKILSKCIPSSLTVVINIIILLIIKKIFNLSPEEITLLSIYLTAFTAFNLLYNISKPLNKYRGILLTFLVLSFTLVVLTKYNFFYMTFPAIKVIVIFLILMILSIIIYNSLKVIMDKLLSKSKYLNVS